MTTAMRLDRHRARTTADWSETLTGELNRARVAPADHAGILEQFDGALEAPFENTTGWRFVVEELRRIGEVLLADPVRPVHAQEARSAQRIIVRT